jgi:hypothetical protein
MVDLMARPLSLLVGQTAESWVDLMAAQRAGQKALQMVGCWVAPLMVAQMAGWKAFQTAGCWVALMAGKRAGWTVGKKDQLIYLVFH